MVKNIEDKTKGDGYWDASEAWNEDMWEEERLNRKSQGAMDVSTRASELARKSSEKGQRMKSRADDTRERIERSRGPPGISESDYRRVKKDIQKKSKE